MAVPLSSSKGNVRDACSSRPGTGCSLDFGFSPRSVTISRCGFSGLQFQILSPTFPKP